MTALTDDLLVRCEDEPIRIPGHIQPHGALLAVARGERTVLWASANLAEVLGVAFDPARHRRLDDIPGLSADLLARPDAASGPEPGETPFARTCRVAGRPFHAAVHATPQAVVLEFEPAVPAEAAADPVGMEFARFLEHLESAADVADMCRSAAREVRRLTAYDRVLVYRFEDNWDGVVVAEDGGGALPSFLGHRFPASDIPAQARELYRLNRQRYIPDADYRPVPLGACGEAASGGPLDLGFAALRSVSPVHLEYMRNMGTLASMSFSILVDGALWGLVSCHNARPGAVPRTARDACDAVCRVLSLQIGSRRRSAHAAELVHLREVESDLITRLSRESDLGEGLRANAAPWLALARADGAALVIDDDICTAGSTPPREDIWKIAEGLRERRPGDLFVTASLAAEHPGAEAYAEAASGLLAAPVSRLHPAFLMWFRRERISSVTWGGQPPSAAAGPAAHLTPRRSFERWQQQVRLTAPPWSQAEIDSARHFSDSVVNFVLLRAEERAALSDRLERTNRELEAFSYSISHDLRAPFRQVSGFAQLLRDHGRLDDTGQHYLANISEAATMAGQLVDDLLSFAHLGRKEVAKSAVDMDKLVAEARKVLETETAGRPIDWRVSPLPPALGDAALLRQALINLLSNAVKFTRGRDPAVIRVEGRRIDGHAHYSVTDNGVGFNMKYVGKIFGVFQRLHRAEDYEGTGIGLAFTHRIIERHGGRIGAEGELGVGARITFSLPVEGERQ